MGITDRFITQRNLKGRRSMSSISKTQALANSSFNAEEFIKSLQLFDMVDLELLLDWYTLYEDSLFDQQIEAIKGHIYLRNSLLGRELL
jgi:hypothetical protein